MISVHNPLAYIHIAYVYIMYITRCTYMSLYYYYIYVYNKLCECMLRCVVGLGMWYSSN